MDSGVPPTERRTTVERRATPRQGPDRRRSSRARATPTAQPSQRTRKTASSSNVSVADHIDPLMSSSVPNVLDPAPVPLATNNSTRTRQSAPRKRTPSAQRAAADEVATTELVSPNGQAFEAHVEARSVVPEMAPDHKATSTPESGPSNIVQRTFKPQFLRATRRLTRTLQPVIARRHRPRVRRVTRVVRHIDTWSVFKIALLFNIFLYAVCLTAGVMLWRVALSTGTIENIERFFESFGWQTFELKGGEIYHNAWIAGLFGVVGLTGLAVLVATVFNLITDLVGGIRVTVLEEEVTAREPYVVSWPRLLRPGTPPRDQPRTEPRDEPSPD